MKTSRGLVFAIVCSVSCLMIVFSVGSQERTPEMSFTDVQSFINEQLVRGFPVEEAVSSALEIGIKPELICAVLHAQKLDPGKIVLTLIQEGVPLKLAASSVITVFGVEAAPVVKAALNTHDVIEMAKVVTTIEEIVSALDKTVTATTSPTSIAAAQAENQSAASSDALASPSLSPTDSESESQSLAAQTTQPDLTLSEPSVPVLQESLPQSIALVTPVVTPPVLGGGGGVSRN